MLDKTRATVAREVDAILSRIDSVTGTPTVVDKEMALFEARVKATGRATFIGMVDGS